MKISEESIASQESENPTRRKLIKSAVAGGVVVTAAELMPTNWTKPVIQSVVLPAHAATTMLTYTVTVTNNTMAQALTPAVVVVHGGDYAPPGVGDMASAGLKTLAEIGMPTGYIAESTAAGGMAYVAGDMAFPSGMMRTVDITAAAGSMITVVSMYAHTNDTIAVATLMLADGATATGTDLDAGTEENVDGNDPTTQGPAGPDMGADTVPQAPIAAGTHVIDGHMTVSVSMA